MMKMKKIYYFENQINCEVIQRIPKEARKIEWEQWITSEDSKRRSKRYEEIISKDIRENYHERNNVLNMQGINKNNERYMNYDRLKWKQKQK